MAETFRLTCFSYLGYSKAHANSLHARKSRGCAGFAGGNARKAAMGFRVAPVKRQWRLPLLLPVANAKQAAPARRRL
ncbi:MULTISPECIES: hypothetical protein [Pseudomonas]|uniref:hypothetical protein n=1 Tax=Pseudomonas TaxID=286 RepID=UPI00114CAB81|nr:MULTISPECIES: hypothetical protein [Pseudomonas]